MKVFPCCIANANGALCACGKSDADVLLTDLHRALKEREKLRQHIISLWATISHPGNADATVGRMRRELQNELRFAIDAGLSELKTLEITTDEASNTLMDGSARPQQCGGGS